MSEACSVFHSFVVVFLRIYFCSFNKLSEYTGWCVFSLCNSPCFFLRFMLIYSSIFRSTLRTTRTTVSPPILQLQLALHPPSQVAHDTHPAYTTHCLQYILSAPTTTDVNGRADSDWRKGLETRLFLE